MIDPAQREMALEHRPEVVTVSIKGHPIDCARWLARFATLVDSTDNNTTRKFNHHCFRIYPGKKVK